MPLNRPAFRYAITAVSLVAGTALFFALLGFVLRHLPEPIGSRAELFEEGAWATLWLTLVAGSAGLFLGIGAALAKDGGPAPIRWVVRTYIHVFRGTPLLTQILFFYYAVPVIFPWLRLNEFSAAAGALALNVGAYNAEAVRAGLLAVPAGQGEAARCLGLSRSVIVRLVILPQALPVMAPPLLNNLVALLKDSAMASSIGLLELTLVGNRVSAETFLPVPVFLTIAAIYLVLTTALTLVSHFLLTTQGRR